MTEPNQPTDEAPLPRFDRPPDDEKDDAFRATVAELADKTGDHGRAIADVVRHSEKISAVRSVSLRPKETHLKFVPCNPSLVPAADGGWWAIVRTVNWRQQGAQQYRTDPEFGGVCLTTNFLLRLGDDLTPQSEVRISEPELVRREDSPRPVRGMEDMRLYWDESERELRAVFTLLNNSRCKEGHICLARVTLLPDGTASDIFELPSPAGSTCEKNWLPFLFRGRPCFLYGYDPITIVDESGVIIHQRYCPFNCSSFRGSGGPVSYRGGYLVVVHECSFTPAGRLYVHRFVKYDANFNFADVSRPFFFDHKGVEFCSGLVASGSDFYLSCGIEDAEARIVVVAGVTVESMWLDFAGRLGRYLGCQF